MSWTELHTFAATCAALDIATPAPIARGIELLTIAEAQQEAPSARLLTMSDDELRDRITALSIRHHDSDGRLSARGMRPGIEQIKTDLAAEVHEAMLPELDNIIDTLRPRFDEAAKPFVTAATTYGITYATTSDEVIDLADEGASAAWRDARTAWTKISPIARLRISMSKLFDVSPTQGEAIAAAFPSWPNTEQINYSACFAAADNWSLSTGYYIEGKTVGHLDWFALAAGGLTLNSPSQVRAKFDAARIGSHSTDQVGRLHPMAG